MQCLARHRKNKRTHGDFGINLAGLKDLSFRFTKMQRLPEGFWKYPETVRACFVPIFKRNPKECATKMEEFFKGVRTEPAIVTFNRLRFVMDARPGIRVPGSPRPLAKKAILEILIEHRALNPSFLVLLRMMPTFRCPKLYTPDQVCHFLPPASMLPEFARAAYASLVYKPNCFLAKFFAGSDVTGNPAWILETATAFATAEMLVRFSDKKFSWSHVDLPRTEAQFDAQERVIQVYHDSVESIFLRAEVLGMREFTREWEAPEFVYPFTERDAFRAHLACQRAQEQLKRRSLEITGGLTDNVDASWVEILSSINVAALKPYHGHILAFKFQTPQPHVVTAEHLFGSDYVWLLNSRYEPVFVHCERATLSKVERCTDEEWGRLHNNEEVILPDGSSLQETVKDVRQRLAQVQRALGSEFQHSVAGFDRKKQQLVSARREEKFSAVCDYIRARPTSGQVKQSTLLWQVFFSVTQPKFDRASPLARVCRGMRLALQGRFTKHAAFFDLASPLHSMILKSRGTMCWGCKQQAKARDHEACGTCLKQFAMEI